MEVPQEIYGPYGPYMDFLPQIYGPYGPDMDFLLENMVRTIKIWPVRSMSKWGIPERDISSLHAMGWGSGQMEKLSARRRRRRRRQLSKCHFNQFQFSGLNWSHMRDLGAFVGPISVIFRRAPFL